MCVCVHVRLCLCLSVCVRVRMCVCVDLPSTRCGGAVFSCGCGVVDHFYERVTVDVRNL